MSRSVAMWSAAAALALFCLVAAAWFFRWERLHGSAHAVYLLDRWTGDVYLVNTRSRFRVPRAPTATEFLDGE